MNRVAIAVLALMTASACFIEPIDRSVHHPSPSGCGDGVCQSYETCASCPSDCGMCATSCWDVDLGAGSQGTDGTLQGRSSVQGDGGCGDSWGPQVAYRWSASRSGTYLIAVVGADFRAALEVRDGCGGADLACADSPFGDWSGVLSLAAGQELIIVVSGADGDFGSYRLEIVPAGSSCGDGTCNSGEDCGNCPSDCGDCAPYCGDGYCNGGEDCGNCPSDCGDCAPYCGDGYCDAGEDCGSCPSDCGDCVPYCGDGYCDAGENCESCEADCGSCDP